MTVRAVTPGPDGGVTLSERPDTGPEGWVRVRVASAGICGSDLHLLDAGLAACGLGHEVAGWTPDGTAVAVCPMLACDECPECLAGRGHLCPSTSGTLLGVIGADGGMADAVWVKPSMLLPLSPGLPVGDACLVEPVAVAERAVRRSGVQPGQRVTVVGAGTIGLAVTAAAIDLGAVVDITDTREERLAVAVALGATGPPAGDADIAIDAAGTQGSLDRAAALVRPGGTVTVVGTHWVPVRLGITTQLRELTIRTSYLYDTTDFAAAASLLERTDLAARLITHRLPLERAEEAFTLARTDPSAIKVVLEPAGA